MRPQFPVYERCQGNGTHQCHHQTRACQEIHLSHQFRIVQQNTRAAAGFVAVHVHLVGALEGIVNIVINIGGHMQPYPDKKDNDKLQYIKIAIDTVCQQGAGYYWGNDGAQKRGSYHFCNSGILHISLFKGFE